MPETYLFIKDLINDLERGKIRIPSFQRGFVWDKERISCFIDSIYKGFPFGSILLWRTSNSLRSERSLGPYKLPNNDPKYPIDYVLDGQQRITSIFGIFQNSLVAENNQDTSWTNLFYEINSKDSVPFKYLDNSEEYDKNQFFPLKYVFDSPKYRQITRSLDENIANKIDCLVDIFTKATIPIERFENEDRKYVAIVFERINKKKVDLGTFDLLSVWNWNDQFDLQEKFKEIKEKLEEYGFEDTSDDLLLKCCSAVIMNSSNSEDLIENEDIKIRDKFQEIKTGIFRTLDFLRTDLNIFSPKLLPMENILVVLTAFFASPQKQPSPIHQDHYKIIKRWFWRSCLSQRYAKVSKATDSDLLEIQKLKNGNNCKLGEFNFSLDSNYFLENNLNMKTIASKTFILLLAQNQPLNFIQGTNISLENVLSQGNLKERHHIFPKAYLKKLEFEDAKINCLANYTLLARTDNNKIKNSPPSIYRHLMTKDEKDLDKILSSQFCFMEMFDDNYDLFLQKRAKLLCEKALDLTN
ncbi:DUF262 domain-containing protein [Cuspidothrix issatschenkoi LEGE 03284]|uniref:GmrSD restriction endonuclease domain-containing protein n=1 Tax=Cuspidothrix issatschenkoi TaxID=230752 RepID=UPI0018803285|nr:DUF262 domain-containing protein [Cuspidothrix issatschenkoi]MBE9231608.1 DUF262 domain-containing protein [Cuspidothrix issatschenkoi LEGE 03284]